MHVSDLGNNCEPLPVVRSLRIVKVPRVLGSLLETAVDQVCNCYEPRPSFPGLAMDGHYIVLVGLQKRVDVGAAGHKELHSARVVVREWISDTRLDSWYKC